MSPRIKWAIRRPRVKSAIGPIARYSTEVARVYLDDARNVVDSLRRVDVVIADPPYASGARRSAEKSVRGKTMLRSLKDDAKWFAADSMTSIGFHWLVGSVFSAIRRRLAEGTHVYVFSDWRQLATTIGVLESVGFRVNHALVWNKTYYGMGAYFRNQHEHVVFASVGQPRPLPRRDVGSVLSFKPVSPRSRKHPTEKPIDLLRLLVSLSSETGDVVLDPFCGAGSTLLASRAEGRRAIGIDVDPRYVEAAIARLREVG